MPYIKQGRRQEVLDTKHPEDAGELNYLLTMFVLSYWFNRQNYQAIADITGVLENIKQEFYRRIAVPYEDMKKEHNGDVFDILGGN